MSTIESARAAVRRLKSTMERMEDSLNSLETKKHKYGPYSTGEYYEKFRGMDTAAAKRASMELSRELSQFRKTI